MKKWAGRDFNMGQLGEVSLTIPVLCTLLMLLDTESMNRWAWWLMEHRGARLRTVRI